MRREYAKCCGFHFFGTCGRFVQNPLTFGGEGEAIDPGIRGMCAADEEATIGEPGNRQTHILWSDEREPREIGRREGLIRREVRENFDLQNREIHIRKRCGEFLPQRMSKLRQQAGGAILRIECRFHRSTIIASACYCFKARRRRWLFVNRACGACI